MKCVVFGATGYIGGRLIPELLRAGHSVRAVARTPEKLAGAPWSAEIEVIRGDVTDSESIARAVADQEVIYYLVHSLNRRDFVDVDNRAAQAVSDAAREAGATRIVYLGGITPDQEPLSQHLASRTEVGRLLLDSGVPTVVLRAAVILGSGSASFEILRYLSERLPVMVTPRWVKNRIQPIAIRDVLHYLVESADLPPEVNRAFDIGGPDVLTYLEMMRGYAAVTSLRRRLIVPVPVLTPWLSAQWVNLVTPVPRSIAVPLIESMVHEVICSESDIAGYIPAPAEGLLPFREAVRLAVSRVSSFDVPTRWSDATWPGVPSDPLPTDPDWAGGTVYQDIRERSTTAAPQKLWDVIESIGGERGWYSFPMAWSARGWIDRLTGGVGLRRGRRDPERLRVGEALDWWRVEELNRPEFLRLRAEMRVPGRAWLELAVTPDGHGGSIYRQRAVFEPHGLAGQLYWKAVAPFHGVVFGGMARNITGAAEKAFAKRDR